MLKTQGGSASVKPNPMLFMPRDLYMSQSFVFFCLLLF